jgi:SNF2 family DNA or RNA helicase
MDQAEYKNTFCEYLTIKKQLGHKQLYKEFIVGYHNVDYLYDMIEPYVFKADLHIDTKKHYFDLNYSLTPAENQQHEEIKEKYLDDERMEFRNNNIFLEITQKLQHNYSCSPEKFQIIEKLLQINDPNKVAIVAKYIDTQEELKKRFPDIRILSWQKNAFALNLQQYNILIKFDKHWDYALHDQIEHRIYRQGQELDCKIYNLTANVGLDGLMDKNVKQKGRLLKAFKLKSIKEIKKML